ncbi:MAG TPA: HEXXH motif-containing putative peptide modification protein [Thermoanaerobaculia bacterium]|nr:HEXXH motif-containing putative peptide modification protein [Thermoanaerobaculia bacterium]
MRYLDKRRVVLNMQLAAAHLTGTEPPPSAELKQEFIAGLNDVQSTSIRSIKDDLYWEFDNPGLVNLLVEKTVFSLAEVSGGVHLLPDNERKQVIHNLEAAKALLADADPNLYYLLTQLVGSVAIYQIPYRDGGSVSCCIGLIWLSPHKDWQVDYYAEMLVHEFVHNSVFLEDMVRGIMPNPTLLDRDEALSISAIRQTRRPYDKAFHSACVAAAIMYYYHCSGDVKKAETYIVPLQRTVADLSEADGALRAQGLDLLTDNGREIVEELRRFIVHGPDYSVIANALATH